MACLPASEMALGSSISSSRKISSCWLLKIGGLANSASTGSIILRVAFCVSVCQVNWVNRTVSKRAPEGTKEAGLVEKQEVHLATDQLHSYMQ